jgi:N-methylhydantoinase A/oxoprolinase/acetone carboxylase beta subunit
MFESGKTARLAIDIGGTFTDLALEAGDRLATAKVLTTPAKGGQHMAMCAVRVRAIGPEARAIVPHRAGPACGGQ